MLSFPSHLFTLVNFLWFWCLVFGVDLFTFNLYLLSQCTASASSSFFTRDAPHNPYFADNKQEQHSRKFLLLFRDPTFISLPYSWNYARTDGSMPTCLTQRNGRTIRKRTARGGDGSQSLNPKRRGSEVWKHILSFVFVLNMYKRKLQRFEVSECLYRLYFLSNVFFTLLWQSSSLLYCLSTSSL